MRIIRPIGNRTSKCASKIEGYFAELPKEYMQLVEVTEEAYELAQKYLDKKVVGRTSVDDCRHIAIATINKVDILVSWNLNIL